jgi:hypothetical protein
MDGDASSVSQWLASAGVEARFCQQFLYEDIGAAACCAGHTLTACAAPRCAVLRR